MNSGYGRKTSSSVPSGYSTTSGCLPGYDPNVGNGDDAGGSLTGTTNSGEDNERNVESRALTQNEIALYNARWRI